MHVEWICFILNMQGIFTVDYSIMHVDFIFNKFIHTMEIFCVEIDWDINEG